MCIEDRTIFGGTYNSIGGITLELRNIKGHTWAAEGPVNIGLYERDGEAVLIDSGNDSSFGRKLLKLAESHGFAIKWIINTHFHADHIGGNAFIQKRTNCGIAASPKEAPFINMPEGEPEHLWSAAAPKAICNKFFRAETSAVTKLLSYGDELEGWGLKAVALPGHAHGQIGIMTDDSVLFCADSVISPAILRKYGIPFLSDFDMAMETFTLLENFKADHFVPSHGEICSDILPLVGANRECLINLSKEITEICKEPLSRDEIVGRLAQNRALEMNMGQYVLAHASVAAILTPLIDTGVLVSDFSEGTLKIVKA